MRALVLLLVFTTRCLYAQQPADIAQALETANTLIRDGKLKDAENVLKELNDISSLPDGIRPLILNTYGSLNMNRGRNDLALEKLKEAQEIWEHSGKDQTLEAAETLSLLGNLYRVTGKYKQAEEVLNMALIVRKNNLPQNDERVAASYNDLGLVYSSSDPDKALTFYEDALSIYEKNHGKVDPKIAIAKTNIAFLNAQLEMFGDAITDFESALAIWNNTYSGAHPSKAFVIYNLGQTYEHMKNFVDARAYYEKALAMYRESYGNIHPDIARVCNSLGNLESADGNFEKALDYFQSALAANHPSFRAASPESNPSVRNYYDGNVMLYSLLFKAEALENQYLKKTLRFKDLLYAIRTLQSSDTLINTLRQHISNESDKISLGAIANEVYSDGVRISMEAANAALKKQGYLENAFFFSERSKAAVLLGAISDSNAKTYAGIPPELLEQEKQLKASIALCSQQLAQKPDTDVEKNLRERFFSLNRAYESFIASLEKNYPAYFNLKFNTTSPSVSTLQLNLTPSTLLISYFIDEKMNTLYAFRISRTSINVDEHALTAGFDRHITSLRNGLLFSEISIFKQSAQYLSPYLIPNHIRPRFDNLVVVPAGRISTIPLEVLFTAKARKATTFSELPFLIKKYSVRYDFSSQLILEKKIASRNSDPAVLLCAPINFSQSAALPDLPGTKEEVNDINTIFENNHFPGRVLIEEQANEENLKKEDLKKYAYLHFATHGVVDETAPELSRIYMRTNGGGDDGVLYAGEIYNLELNADLVTLSACETGLGKISKGEGVIGLSRALVYAGAKNCVVSFWKVADESTTILMKNYYRQLLDAKGKGFATSLRSAKLAMLKDPQYSSPYYWAPFILIGY